MSLLEALCLACVTPQAVDNNMGHSSISAVIGLVNMFLLLLNFLPFSSVQSAANDGALCYSLQGDNYTCGGCIALHPSCAWCQAQDFDKDNRFTRCDTYDRLAEHGCPTNKIEYPKSSVDIIRNEQLSDDDSKPEVVQFRPQKVVINIRPKDTVFFEIEVGQPVNYPVDLYYLMDLSFSMADDKNKLSELGDKLGTLCSCMHFKVYVVISMFSAFPAARMEKITKNFKLGFGSFVDKKVMPFVDPRKEKANRPCDFCIEPYGFRHHLDMTTDARRFKEKIGWREKSRKMIVFSTDAGFHYAGDGRLGGLVVPNDGQCHLDSDGYYTKSIDFDYPSIAQIHKTLKDTRANIIFAVTKEQLPLYKKLNDALPDISSSVGVLADDSSNIVTLIAKEYGDITEKISLNDDVNSSVGLNISYLTACQGTVHEYKTFCDGVSVGKRVSFNVSVHLERCTPEKRLDFTIHRTGLQEGVEVEVNVLCDCECDKHDIIPKAEICNYHGTLSCGVCICDEGFVGRHCECNSTGVSTAQMDMLCRKGNDSEQQICSDRGYCSCGQCICQKRNDPKELIYGKYCECDNYNCPRRNRLLCSDHGECGCDSVCNCTTGWTGAACECPDHQRDCVSPNGKICNDRGKCECGVCKCFRDLRYSGRTCEICVTCTEQCEVYRPCVLCFGWGHGPLNESMCAQCPYTMHLVDDHKAYGMNETTFDCQYVDPADRCTYYYRYLYDETLNETVIWIREGKGQQLLVRNLQSPLKLLSNIFRVSYRIRSFLMCHIAFEISTDCPVPVPILPIVLGVIAGIVLIGLVLLLIWKLLTIIHDRREFAKFENERLMARWDTGENPIFHPATTTFKNPAYGIK
uniref:Integrin beta n=1 Tax=Romanomermis culicivorax TaxID=13658 RepID=A0A915I8T4_ROMCU